ncbi:hypothetical protein EYD86_21345 [Shigella sonnei]|nr:hypothetical protein [Shigella sonnei]
MSRIEAVFFDCDGTLVDSEVICSRAYVTMFQEFGITLDPEEVFKRFKGVKLYEIIDIVSILSGDSLVVRIIPALLAGVVMSRIITRLPGLDISCPETDSLS